MLLQEALNKTVSNPDLYILKRESWKDNRNINCLDNLDIIARDWRVEYSNDKKD